MAVVAATIVNKPDSTTSPQIIASSHTFHATWTALLNGDSGAPFKSPGYSDKSIQVFGTFGPGGTLIIEGSNDGGTTYATLTDEQGAALSFIAAGLKAILPNVEVIRPRVTAGDGTTSLTAVLLARG